MSASDTDLPVHLMLFDVNLSYIEKNPDELSQNKLQIFFFMWGNFARKLEKMQIGSGDKLSVEKEKEIDFRGWQSQWKGGKKPDKKMILSLAVNNQGWYSEDL